MRLKTEKSMQMIILTLKEGFYSKPVTIMQPFTFHTHFSSREGRGSSRSRKTSRFSASSGFIVGDVATPPGPFSASCLLSRWCSPQYSSRQSFFGHYGHVEARILLFGEAAS